MISKSSDIHTFCYDKSLFPDLPLEHQLCFIRDELRDVSIQLLYLNGSNQFNIDSFYKQLTLFVNRLDLYLQRR